MAALSTFSFLDRQVLALLVPDLKRSLGITDVQFGVLSGPAFIVVYNVVLVLAALVVDRSNRVRLIVVGAALWTLMTILSGFAQSFEQLLVLRAGLAMGEALLGPAAISLIGDLFSRDDRPLPTAVYIAGSVIGSTGSTMLSAVVLQLAGWLSPLFSGSAIADAWRLTLIGVGVPGFLLAIALLLVGREPLRPAREAEPAPASTAPSSHIGRHWPLYLCIFVGYAAAGMLSTALTIWGPAHLTRYHGFTQVHAGYALGIASLACGVAGTLLLPALFRSRVRSHHVGALPTIAAAAMLMAAVAAAIGGLTVSPLLCLACFGAVMFFTMGVGTLPTLVIQLYAPSHLRGRISAALFFTLYLLSVGVTPVIIPLMAHGLFEGDNALGKAIAAVSTLFGLLATGLFLLARRPLLRAETAAAAQADRG